LFERSKTFTTWINLLLFMCEFQMIIIKKNIFYYLKKTILWKKKKKYLRVGDKCEGANGIWTRLIFRQKCEANLTGPWYKYTTIEIVLKYTTFGSTTLDPNSFYLQLQKQNSQILIEFSTRSILPRFFLHSLYLLPFLNHS
jgi:hypothetical protein